MSDIPRDKYEILDLIFTFFNSICMSLSTIFLLSNLVVSLIFVFVIIFFTLGVLYFWRARNPFNIYFIRALAFNNLFFTFVALVFYFSSLSFLTTYPVGYVLLLFPSIIYLLISFKFKSSTLAGIRDKRAGLMLAYSGSHKAARREFIKENPEEERKRKELLAKQKEEYKYKIIIGLAMALTLSSLTALIFGL
jgi:hypothetical protein